MLTSGQKPAPAEDDERSEMMGRGRNQRRSILRPDYTSRRMKTARVRTAATIVGTACLCGVIAAQAPSTRRFDVMEKTIPELGAAMAAGAVT